MYEERTDRPRNEWKNEPYVAWTYIAMQRKHAVSN